MFGRNEQNSVSSEQLVDDGKRLTCKVPSAKELLKSKLLKGILFTIVFAITVPPLLFFFLIDLGYSPQEQTHTCLVEYGYRVSCGRANISASDCATILCCYDDDTGECYHPIPSEYKYERNVDSTDRNYTAAQTQTPLGNASLQQLTVSVQEIDSVKVKIILHETDVSYEESEITDKTYNVTVYQDTLYVEVSRPSTADVLFTTAKGPLIASEGYWEWTMQLTTERLMGLGEIYLHENTTYRKVIYKNKHDHNSLPIFMAYKNGSYHGIVIEHDGPLEVTVLPSFLVVVKSLVGSYISVTICTGPTPADVVRQQRVYELTVPPYWVLGPHICRIDNETNAELVLKEYSEFMANSTLEFASDCIHESLVSIVNETTAAEFADLISNVQNTSRLLISVPPQIELNSGLYNFALEVDLLYKNYTGEVLNGTYRGKQVAYPDFTHPSIGEFFNEFVEQLPTRTVDGVVLIDNWPDEEQYEMSPNGTFPYMSEELITAMSGTLPYNATGYSNTSHIFKHNSYGRSQAELFGNLSDFVMTASYDYGYQGAAHIQNVNISWTNLHAAIRTSLYHSIFGTPLISIPVCGSTSWYNETTNEALCIRWYIFAATMPIFRIASEKPRRDPASLGSGHATRIAEDAIAKRRQLSLYFHTVLSAEEPLMRPMFYDFYDDNETLVLDRQYMVGPDLLVAHPVVPDASSIRIYLPPNVGTWYEFWGGAPYTELGSLRWSVVETDWINFIKGGSILPLRNTNANGESLDTLTLAVALNCSGLSSNCTAAGTLSFSSAVMTFSANESGIAVANLMDAANDVGCDGARQWPYVIESVNVYGLDSHILVSNFSSVDLCDVTSDEYFINYFEYV